MDDTEREVSLFRNGRNQAVRIPREFELPGTRAVMRREGNRLILEPAPERKGLLMTITTFEVIDDEDFPDVDDGLLPLDDIDL